jgi:signal transduction histidine kinase/CheY-like chemotaxis protein
MTRVKDKTHREIIDPYKAPSSAPINPLIRSYNESDGFTSVTRWTYLSACIDLLYTLYSFISWFYLCTIGSPFASYIIACLEHLIADPINSSLLSLFLFMISTLVVTTKTQTADISKDIRLNLEASAPLLWTCDRYNWYASRGPANERLVWSTIIGALSGSSCSLAIMCMLSLMMPTVAQAKTKYAQGGVILLLMNIITNALLFQPGAGSTCLIVQGNGVSTVRLFESQRFIYWACTMPIILVMLASEAGLKKSSIINVFIAQVIAVICCANAYLVMHNSSLLLSFSAVAVCFYCYVSKILLQSLSISGSSLVESFRIIHNGIKKASRTFISRSNENSSLNSITTINVFNASEKEDANFKNRFSKAIVTLVVKLIAPAFVAIWYCYPLLLVLSAINLLEPAMEISLFIILDVVTIILFSCYCILEKSARTDDLVEEQLVKVTRQRELVNAGRSAKHILMRLVFHELQAPLNALSLGLDDVFANIGLLQKLECHRETHPHLPPQQEHQVIVRDLVVSTEILIENVVAMTRLLDRFLALENTATEGGRIDLEFSTFSPVDMARESMRLLTSPAGLKRVSLDLVVHKDIPAAISGDENRLKQVLNNLLSNALKFSPAESKITVRLTLCYAVIEEDASMKSKDASQYNSKEPTSAVLRRFLNASIAASSSGLSSTISSIGTRAGLGFLLASFKATSKVAPEPESAVLQRSTSEHSVTSVQGCSKDEQDKEDLVTPISVDAAAAVVDERIHTFIRFEIIDSGPGITQDDVMELFKPFADPIKGGGRMGLSICKRIIELSSGVIGVERCIGDSVLEPLSNRGSTFFFAVPVEEIITSPLQHHLFKTRLLEDTVILHSDKLQEDLFDSTGARSHLENAYNHNISSPTWNSTSSPVIENSSSESGFNIPRQGIFPHHTRAGRRGIESPPLFKRMGRNEKQSHKPHTDEKQTAVLHITMPSSPGIVDRYGTSSSSLFAFESHAHRPHLGTGRLDVFPGLALTISSLQSTSQSQSQTQSQTQSQSGTLQSLEIAETFPSRLCPLLEPIDETEKTGRSLCDVVVAATTKDEVMEDETTLLHTCLLVDSVESNRTFLRRLLTRRGLKTVHCVASGEEALSLLGMLSKSERDEIQVCLVFLEMPRLNGAEITSRLRSEPLCFSCPIIGISGSEQEDARKILQTAGASAVITLPIRSDSLEYVFRHFNFSFVI